MQNIISGREMPAGGFTDSKGAVARGAALNARNFLLRTVHWQVSVRHPDLVNCEPKPPPRPR